MRSPVMKDAILEGVARYGYIEVTASIICEMFPFNYSDIELAALAFGGHRLPLTTSGQVDAFCERHGLFVRKDYVRNTFLFFPKDVKEESCQSFHR